LKYNVANGGDCEGFYLLAQNFQMKPYIHFIMTLKKQSPDKKKQEINPENPKGEKVHRAESRKSKDDELADKSEGFGGSPEELNQYRIQKRDDNENK
jgi:hypothetical protein